MHPFYITVSTLPLVQVSAQIQIHSLLLYSLNPMRQQTDTTGERSGAAPTDLRAFREMGLLPAASPEYLWDIKSYHPSQFMHCLYAKLASIKCTNLEISEVFFVLRSTNVKLALASLDARSLSVK
uniref:SFRICE_002857 n=1 Tax=Spodoptera frugiperda TaxID=7108 RepID=A0A2H1WTA3_SPOFR